MITPFDRQIGRFTPTLSEYNRSNVLGDSFCYFFPKIALHTRPGDIGSTSMRTPTAA